MTKEIISFNVSPATAALVEALVAVPYGGQITYDDLCKTSDLLDLRRNLASARRIAARDHGAVFTVVRKVGLLRIRAEDAALVGQAGRRKIRRAATKSVREMASMIRGDNNLSDESRRKIGAEIAHNGLLAHLATNTSHDKIAASPILADSARADARLFTALMSTKDGGEAKPDGTV